MSRTIPPEIGKLSSLRRLDLSNNHFYGDIPASLGHLQSLQYLLLCLPTPEPRSKKEKSLTLPYCLREEKTRKEKTLRRLRLRLREEKSRSAAPPSVTADRRTVCYHLLLCSLTLAASTAVRIVGNPLICGDGQQKDCFGIQPMANLTDTQSVPLSGNVRNHKVAVALGSSIGCISFLFLTVGLLFWWRQRRNRHILFDIDGIVLCIKNRAGASKLCYCIDIRVDSTTLHKSRFLTSKKDLASAGGTKRAMCCVLVMTKPAKGELEAEVIEKLQSDYDQITSEVVDLT